MKPSPQQLRPHYREALKYIGAIREAADTYGIPIEVIIGIGSRESGWGLLLKPRGPGGTGDWAPRNGRMPPDGLGWGRGLMQIDYAAHDFARSDVWQLPGANIRAGCGIFYSGWLSVAAGLHRDILEDCLPEALAAYNAGVSRVVRFIRRGRPWDEATTGGDYSADVLRRARVFRGWMDAVAQKWRTTPHNSNHIR